MPDSTILNLTQLSELPANGDAIPIVDISDTTMHASGTTKYVTFQDAVGNALNDRVTSVTTGITGADKITNIVSLTRNEYDALVTKNPSTLYVVVG